MNDYFHGLQYSETGDCATMVSSNYKMCYDVVPSALLDDEDVFEPKGEADNSSEWVERDKLDWSLKFDEDMDAKGIPISWLAVDSIQEGEQWYREHTRMPECMIHYIARYHWGDGLKTSEDLPKKSGRKKKADETSGGS
eukprot:SAG22_NODE_269_length_13236_cov_124.463424_5_plen_139_part_00